MKFLFTAATLVLLAACAETTSETQGTFTARGDTYKTMTRQFQRSDGSTYSRMTIYVGAERVSCIPGDQADCERALIDTFHRNRGGV